MLGVDPHRFRIDPESRKEVRQTYNIPTDQVNTFTILCKLYHLVRCLLKLQQEHLLISLKHLCYVCATLIATKIKVMGRASGSNCAPHAQKSAFFPLLLAERTLIAVNREVKAKFIKKREY
jgi:hypothetical protein